jgi:hypothetical protein
MGKLMVGNDGSVMDIDPRDEPAAVRHGFVDYGSPEHLSAMGVAAPGMGVRVPVPRDLQANSGQQTNEIGNLVIVPKQGEPFAQTMQRGAAYGHTVTPGMRAAEMRTAPRKAAAVLALAPAMGAAGAAGLAGADLGAYQAAKGAGYAGAAIGASGAAYGVKSAAGLAVKAAQSPLGRAILSRVGQGLTITAALELLKKLGL